MSENLTFLAKMGFLLKFYLIKFDIIYQNVGGYANGV